MLRFFEPETDTWLPPAATPPLPPRRHITAVDSRPQADQEVRHPQLNSDAPAAAGRRAPSALATVDLVKGRWFPAAPSPENTGSRSSSPNSSSSVDSMNSNCRMSIAWPNRDANFIFQGGEGCYSSNSVNYARKDQHEKRRTINNMEGGARESKKQKGGVVYLPLINKSASSQPSKMMPTHQEIFKGSLQVMSKSMKIGEKVTALQQLVSPFGKTDTSSVLREAAIYINTLHEQIRVLSSHYFESILSYKTFDDQVKNGGERYHQKKTKNFAEVGLCMVQISPRLTNLLNQEPLDRYSNEISLPSRP